MTLTTSRPHAESMLRFLGQRAEQLELFHSGNARLVIQQFCDWFDRDDIIGLVAQALHRRVNISVKAWHEQATRDGKVPPLPEDPAACMAFRYATLKHVRMEKVDLRFFVSNLFPGTYLDEKLMRWKRLIVHPFGSDCRTLGEGVTALLGDGEWVDLPALLDAYLDGPFVTEGFGPRPWSDEDDRRVEADEKARRSGGAGRAPAPPPATPAAPAPSSPETALDALEAAVRGAGLPDAERDELLLDVAALRLEGERRVARPERALGRLSDMAKARAALGEACARVRAAVEARG